MAAELISKVCTTYHTYSFKNERILKKTKWYVMESKQSGKLKPQLEENIERVEWIAQDKMNKVVSDTYSSIRYVIQQFIINQTQIPSKV